MAALALCFLNIKRRLACMHSQGRLLCRTMRRILIFERASWLIVSGFWGSVKSWVDHAREEETERGEVNREPKEDFVRLQRPKGGLRI